MKLLIVDDEQIIRNGLENAILKNFPHIDLLPCASNGIQGFESTQRYQPDIVITDIRMPGMDGLELIDKLVSGNFDGEILIISGYNEFEYASQAMKMGVKHYILKPCKDEELCREISQAVEDVKNRKNIKCYLEQYSRDKEMLLSQAKQQLLNDIIFGENYSNESIERFQNLYSFYPESIRMLVAQVDDGGNLYQDLCLKKVIDEAIGCYSESICTMIGSKVISITEDRSENALLSLCSKVFFLYGKYYSNNIYIAVSEQGIFNQIAMMYKYTSNMLNYRFFNDESTVITRKLLKDNHIEEGIINVSGLIHSIVQAISSDRMNDVRKMLDEFFDFFSNTGIDFQIVKTYVFELIVSIMRCGRYQDIDRHMKEAFNAANFTTLQQYRDLVTSMVKAIGCDYRGQIFHQSIQKAVAYIDAHISEQDLSIRKLATEVLFIRADYLGKLFRQYTGYKVSTYVHNKRMHLAKKLLCEKNYKIYEISSMTGFGDNPEYFCHVFKKYTGYSPTQFREIHMLKKHRTDLEWREDTPVIKER